jgi:hypothetical protein
LIRWCRYESPDPLHVVRGTFRDGIHGPYHMGIVFCIARIRMACGDGFNFEEIDMMISMNKKYVTRNGKYDAKVVYIHDKGQYPVVVVITGITNGKISVFQTRSNGRMYMTSEDGLDLIEVPENTQDGWVKFDAENDEVPLLYLNDLIEIRLSNWKTSDVSTPVLASNVDFDMSSNPVVAYRVVKKAGVKP